MIVYCYFQNQTKCISLLRESVPEGVNFQELDIPNSSYLDFIEYNSQTNQFYILPENEIQNIKNQKQADEKKIFIKQKIKLFEDTILSKYPNSEIYSWSYKIREAEKVISNNYTIQEVPIIFNELKTELNRDPDNTEILNRANQILQKKSEYEIVSGKIAGIRKKIETMTNQEIINLDIDQLFNQVFGV